MENFTKYRLVEHIGGRDGLPICGQPIPLPEGHIVHLLGDNRLGNCRECIKGSKPMLDGRRRAMQEMLTRCRF